MGLSVKAVYKKFAPIFNSTSPVPTKKHTWNFCSINFELLKIIWQKKKYQNYNDWPTRLRILCRKALIGEVEVDYSVGILEEGLNAQVVDAIRREKKIRYLLWGL